MEEETLVQKQQLVSEEECWSGCGLRNQALLRFAGQTAQSWRSC